MVELTELKRRLLEEQEARKEAEALLGEKNEDLAVCTKELAALALFSEVSPHPYLRFSEEGRLLCANPRARELFSAEIEQGLTLNILFPETLDLNLKRIVDKDLTVPLKVTQGSACYRAHIRGISNARHINIYLNDITSLERIKNEIEEDRIEIEQLIASIRSILVGINDEGIVTRWNDEAEAAFGLSVHETIGKHIDQCIYTWSLGTFDVVKELMEGERYLVVEDARFERPEGATEGHLNIAITRVFNLYQQPVGYLMLAHDVTEKKELEIQLLQSQKMESLGQLAAGIAHEINTPIQFIGDNTHFLDNAFKRLNKVLEVNDRFLEMYKEDLPVDSLVVEIEEIIKTSKIAYMRSEIPYAIEEALKGLEQVASIVKGMKQFSHPGTGEKKLLNINQCIKDTITVSRNEWKYVAELEVDLDAELPSAMCHANEINQVILNMIVNAAHAIEKTIEDGTQSKGKITIKTFAAADNVILEISDTGSGIPQEVVDKIFDPFFTTKEPGKGTGQGLSIAYNVIQKHEGAITVETTEGEGTTFRVQLPAHH